MGLTAEQWAVLRRWVPGAVVVRDHSWGLVGTTVLELVHEGRRRIVKAGDAADRHLARELRAHREWLAPWTALGLAPRLLAADDEAKLLLTAYLPGELVQGHAAERDPATYHAAGALLAALHGQPAVVDPAYEAAENAKALAWLGRPHRIDPADVDRLRSEVTSWTSGPVVVVPTHGDWHPRNWLIDDGTVRAIDLGRAALRPALTDLGRLAAGQFRTDPAFEPAFLDGYGTDPREPATWRRECVRAAIGTAGWAHQVQDAGFQAQGLRMIDDVLAGRPPRP